MENQPAQQAEYVARIEQALHAKGLQLCRGMFRTAPWLFSRQRREVMPLVFLYVDAAAGIVVLIAWGASVLGLQIINRSLLNSLWFLGIGLALLAAYAITAIGYDRRLKFRIAGSDIGNLLLQADERLTRIYRYMPSLFGFSILGSRAHNLEDVARLVAVNADWYLATPRYMFRMGWLAPALQAILVVFLVFGWQYDVSPFILFYSLMAGLYATLLWFWEQRRQAISLNRFWEYMEWRFNLDYL